jgi:hypothetical protein
MLFRYILITVIGSQFAESEGDPGGRMPSEICVKMGGSYPFQ